MCELHFVSLFLCPLVESILLSPCGVLVLGLLLIRFDISTVTSENRSRIILNSSSASSLAGLFPALTFSKTVSPVGKLTPPTTAISL